MPQTDEMSAVKAQDAKAEQDGSLLQKEVKVAKKDVAVMKRLRRDDDGDSVPSSTPSRPKKRFKVKGVNPLSCKKKKVATPPPHRTPVKEAPSSVQDGEQVAKKRKRVRIRKRKRDDADSAE